MRSLVRIVRSAAALDGGERRAAVRGIVWLLVARAALRIAPYRAVSRAAARVPPRGAGRLTAEQCGRAIGRAGRLGGGASCLARAVAAECLLRREGWHPTLSLGVTRDAAGQLRAHAWVISDGVTVTGGEEAALYFPLTPSHEP